MKKRAAYNILTLLFFNLLFWVCNLYPKHIIEFGYAGLSVRATVLNLLYHILYFGFLAIFVSKGQTLFSEHDFDVAQTLAQKLCITKIAVLVVWQILMDCFRFYIETITGGFSYLLSDILTVLNWLVIYRILTHKNKVISANKKVSAVLAILTGFAVCACLAFDVGLFMKYTAFEVKYNLFALIQWQSPFDFVHPSFNLTYLHRIAVFLLDTWIGCMLIVFFAVHSNAESKCEKSLRFRALTYSAFLLILFLMPIAAKHVFHVNHSICSARYQSADESDSDGRFSDSVKTLTFRRYNTNKSGNTDIVYAVNTADIYFQSDKGKVKTASVPLYDYPCWVYSFLEEQQRPEGSLGFQKYTIGKQAVYLFGNCAICYVQDGKPVVVDFKKLADFEDSAIVTGVCEQLIGEGNMAVFEYGAEYLYKYDKDFILPYLERYAAGSFDQKERQSLAELFYNPEYITGIANNLLNK